MIVMRIKRLLYINHLGEYKYAKFFAFIIYHHHYHHHF